VLEQPELRCIQFYDFFMMHPQNQYFIQVGESQSRRPPWTERIRTKLAHSHHLAQTTAKFWISKAKLHIAKNK